MADNATVLHPVSNYQKPGRAGLWVMVVAVDITHNGEHSVHQIEVTSGSARPLLEWRPAVRAAVIAYALSELAVTIEDVIFPDLGAM